MVSLTMMARLLEALRPTTRLVLVGDPDQLASVEAGAVLGDLVDAVGRSQRCGRSAALAVEPAVLAGAGRGIALRWPPAVHRSGIAADGRVLDGRGGALGRCAPEVELVEVADDAAAARPTSSTAYARDVQAAGRRCTTRPSAATRSAALAALDAHRLLCAHRRGPRGVHALERAGRALGRRGAPGRCRGPTAATPASRCW